MTVAQGSRARMASVMIAVVFGLVLGLGTLVNAAFAQLPFPTPYPVRLLVTITIEVLQMTYWLMPWLKKRLEPWIYPRRHVA
jgi:antibiotic biosynthesis monooxygenase (ABM) superfamily enzyme